MFNLFDVYDNRTDLLIASVTFDDAKDYAENPGRYCIVWRLNGQVMKPEDFF